MEKKPRSLPHHRTRRDLYPELEPGPPDKFLQSAQEFVADAYTGRDVTRPRELYTFLSLERVPTNLKSRDRQRLKSRSVNTDARRVRFGLEEVIRRRNSIEGIPDSYFRFDIDDFGPEPLPPINTDGDRPVSKEAWPPGSKPVTPFQHIVAEELADEILQSIPISLIKGYHKVNLSTTYIFAPSERLDETLKYNKKVVLPNIKTSDSEREEIAPPSVLTLDSVHNVESIHDKKFQVVNVLSPRKKGTMDQPSHLFGVRPECVFINSQLGEKNPLLRDTNKAENQVPRAAPGLHDLKDFAGYPKEYWKLRAEKISQPADLEADMIDRDLYRLRQLSALKLNSIERTFPMKNDPFRKWRGKGGEPLFSPGQQRLPPKRRRQRYGVASLSETVRRKNSIQNMNLPLTVTITPLKLSAGDAIQEEVEPEEVQSPLKELYVDNGTGQGEPGRVPNNRSIHLADLAQADTTLTSIMANGSEYKPQETTGNSLNTHEKPERNKETGEAISGLGKVTLQRQFEIKKRREQTKKMLKTSVVNFELDSPATMDSARRSQMLTARLLGLTAQSGQPSTNTAPAVSTDQRPAVIDMPRDDVDAVSNEEKSQRQNSESHSSNGKRTPKSSHKPVATVMSLNFKPPPDFTTPPSYPDAVYPVAASSNDQIHEERMEYIAHWTEINNQRRVTHPSPVTAESRVESLDGAGNGNNTHYGNNRLRALQLEVFGERKEESKNIAAPNGRTSYHPEMPAYRLDLQNYPPLNPRQTCGDLTSRRSRSATSTDGGRTVGILGGIFPADLHVQSNQLTVTTTAGSNSRRHGAVRQAPNSAGRSDRLIGLIRTPGARESSLPRRSGSAGPAVEIRFGQQGEVILSSSKEKRGHQSSR